ncbi:MAG: FAD:protein FMN transferase [Oligoflexia bacterium]|nr:FAD:protein FMN transferase [Oligoflexia bacterium]
MQRRDWLKLSGQSALFGCLLSAVPAAALPGAQRWHQSLRPLMGTYVEIAIYAEDAAASQRLLDATFVEMQSWADAISNWESDSFCSRLKLHGRLPRADCPAHLLRLWQVGSELRRMSNGNFNPLCSSLTDLWRAAKLASSLPDRVDLKFAVAAANSTTLEISPDYVNLKGQSGFDVGGIGKGLMADLAVEFLARQGVRYARVACSGDIRFWGDTVWNVEVEDPRADSILRTLRLYGSFGISTSSDARNFWFVDGARQTHLIDCSTGRSAHFNQQVTVIAPNALWADGLATTLSVVPLDTAQQLARALPPVRALIVDQRHQVSITA